MSAQAATTAAAAVLFTCASVALYARLLTELRRFERSRSGEPPWWFGYARDGVNTLGGALLFAAFCAAGYSGPQALALALGMALFTYGCDVAAARVWPERRSGAVLAGSLAAVCSALLALEPSLVGSWLERLFVVAAGAQAR